jgi:hypothetical protein
MSFLDELNSASKTPAEVQNKEMISGEIEAEYNYSKIKDRFIFRAENANYTNVAGKKYIEFYYKTGLDFNLSVNETYTKPLFQSARHYTCRIRMSIKNPNYYYGYINKIKQLAANDGITIQVFCCHKKLGDIPIAYFNIDTEYVYNNSAIFCGKEDFSIELKCSAYF